MVECNLLDFKCIFVNELVGSVTLAIILALIIYFVIAAKLKIGISTTLVLAVPFLLIIGMMFTGITPILAFITMISVFAIGYAVTKFLENR